MPRKEFIVNDKYLDAMAVALHPKTRVFVMEGTIRSIKTVTAIQAFFEAVQQSSETLQVIACEGLDAIRDNILLSDFGLEVCYPNHVVRKKEEIGGYYLQVKDISAESERQKRVLFAGYSRKSDWKKILGKTVDKFLIDEVNNANEQFINECFSRQANVDHPLMIWTLNGDDPNKWIYKDYINRCQIIGDAPASIRAEMQGVKKVSGWYYMHFNMRDNPSMTPEKIARTEAIYPPGSYYHKIKVLGERGVHGKLLYLDYMDRKKHIKPLNHRDYYHFGVGVDIGATRAENSFSLWGFKQDFSKVGGYDNMSFQQCGYKQKTEYLISFVRSYLNKGFNIEYISIDSAEANYITDLKTIFRDLFPNVAVVSSYKATIKQRVDLGIIMFSHNQLEFNDSAGGLKMYDAFAVAKRSDKTNEVREDKNEPHMDKIDSSEYAWTRHMQKILRAAKNYERLD